ncbi:hypothetical protein [Microbacterium sp. LWH12-1.2]
MTRKPLLAAVEEQSDHVELAVIVRTSGLLVDEQTPHTNRPELGDRLGGYTSGG